MTFIKPVSIFLICICCAFLAWVFKPLTGWSARSYPETAPQDRADTSDNQTEFRRLYNQGMAAVNARSYQKAFDYFWRASRIKHNSPDALNMQAFCQRKLGDLGEAFRYYNMALTLRPEFPQAREYLGETHIQAALRQIELLKSYGPSARQELDDLVAAFHDAVSSLPSRSDKGEKK